MSNEIHKKNLLNYLNTFIIENNLSTNEIAKELGCSMPSLERILNGKTFPTDEMIKQSSIMISLGLENYKKLTDKEKEKISEKIGAIGGGILGFSVITSAISASGTVVGLSAAGISSGLAAIGGVVGGTMITGIILTSLIPIAVGFLGFGIAKSIKLIIKNNKTNVETFDSYWELEK